MGSTSVTRPLELKQPALGDDVDDDVGGGREQCMNDGFSGPDFGGNWKLMVRLVVRQHVRSVFLSRRIFSQRECVDESVTSAVSED